MATEREFIEYVADQAASAGSMSFRRMFGEYALYCEGKVVALVCDNQVFVKPTAPGAAWVGTVTEGFPYPGAKPWMLIADELDERDWFARLIRLTADALATALFVLGPDEGLPLLAERFSGVEALFLVRNGEGSFGEVASPGFAAAVAYAEP